jgi:hypothetical protein
MPPIAHVVKGSSATYKLFEKVLGIIEQGVEAFRLIAGSSC